MKAPFIAWWSFEAGGQPQVEARLVRSDFRLPSRLCPVCNQQELHHELSRYDLPIPAAVNGKDIQKMQAMSPGAFSKLVSTITTDPETQMSLLPGTKMGKPVFGVPVRPIDVVWGGLIRPILSEHAIRALQLRSVEIVAVQVEVVSRGCRAGAFFSLIPRICEVLNENWLSLERIQCQACKQWPLKVPWTTPQRVSVDTALVNRKMWPDKCDLLYAPSLGSMFYSSAFVEAFRDAKLTGIEFKQVNWV